MSYPTQPPSQEPMSQQPYHGWPTPSAPQPPKKRNWFRRHPVWTVVLAVLAIILIATAAGGGGSNTEDTGNHNTFATNGDRPDNKIKDRPEPKPEPEYTTAQEQAIGAAEDYLNTMPFSKRGLISQLSSEYGSQFDVEDARFAVRHLDVDWNAQAVQAGKDYLSTMSFSRDGLIDQLSSPYGSQFTRAQAEYAADQLGL